MINTTGSLLFSVISWFGDYFRWTLEYMYGITLFLCDTSAGSCFGLLETFLFWLLQDLGAKKYLMGITLMVGCVAGIPFLAASGYIFKKLGFANTIILGFAFYVIRFMGKIVNGDEDCLCFIVLTR